MFSFDGLLSCLHTDMAVAAEPTASFFSAGESYSYNFCLVTNASKLATQLIGFREKEAASQSVLGSLAVPELHLRDHLCRVWNRLCCFLKAR